MGNKIMELSSLIHGQFRSQAAFSRHIGWSKQHLNKIVNGDKQPSLEEVQTIAEGLSVPFMMIANIFLRQKSPNE